MVSAPSRQLVGLWCAHVCVCPHGSRHQAPPRAHQTLPTAQANLPGTHGTACTHAPRSAPRCGRHICPQTSRAVHAGGRGKPGRGPGNPCRRLSLVAQQQGHPQHWGMRCLHLGFACVCLLQMRRRQRLHRSGLPFHHHAPLAPAQHTTMTKVCTHHVFQQAMVKCCLT